MHQIFVELFALVNIKVGLYL